MSEKPWRLFVGAFPPADIIQTLSELIDGWKEVLPGNSARWVSPEKIHLTLCFFGNVESARVPNLADGLSQVALRHEVFSLQLSGLGVFPNVRRPRVLWVGAGGEVQKLLDVQKDVASVCEPFLEKPDDKPFSAHLTLARIKDPVQAFQTAIELLVANNAKREFGAWRLDEIRLMRSELDRAGSTYTALASFPLGVTS